MNLCKKHDCAYDANECPACEFENQLEEAAQEIKGLQKEIATLENDTE